MTSIHKFTGYKIRKKSHFNSQGTSRQELELYNFIRLEIPNKKILRNDRTVLQGRELDIYIPHYKLAVEFDGLFYHNDSKKDDPMYHLMKTINCEKEGIRLIHVFSDDWESKKKKPLVIDLIRKAIGRYQIINLDKCSLFEIPKEEGRAFLNSYHLQRDNKANIYIGIVYNNTVVQVASFKKNIDNIWEVNRVADKPTIKIEKGLDSILEFFSKKHQGEEIIVSLDRRMFSCNEIKSNNNFREIRPTNPEVYVTKDFKSHIPIQMLKLNEKQIKDAGYVRIYGCGRRRFTNKPLKDLIK